MPYLGEDACVLELACGTGQLTLLSARNAREWVATDFSENMIVQLQKRCGDPDLGNIKFARADATDLTYQEESFEIVVIANGLHIMPFPEKALEEIHRVLKKEGILFAPTFVFSGKCRKLQI